jgi:branched-chain amino acid transport system substrate-binding protein
MKRIGNTVLCVAVAAQLLCVQHAFAGDVKIGFASPLTGIQAHYGTDAQHGAQLAIDEANSQKLTIGGQAVNFVLDPQDDAADPKTGTQVAQRLVDDGVVGVVGHMNSGTSIPASRIYSDAGIPMISMGASSPQLTSQGFKTVYRVINSDNQMGQLAGLSAVETLKGKRIAVLDDRTAFGQGMADEFAKSVKAAGGTVVDRQYTNFQATDFKAQLTQIKSDNADVLFWAGADQQAAGIVKQMRALGLKAAFLGGGAWKNDNFLKLAGPDAEGSYSWEYGAPLAVLKDGPAFDNKIKAKFGVPVVAYAPQSYDATWALIKAMQAANSTDPKVFSPFIRKLSFQGISGQISFKDNGDLAIPVAAFYQVKGGKWEESAIAHGSKIESLKN